MTPTFVPSELNYEDYAGSAYNAYMTSCGGGMAFTAYRDLSEADKTAWEAVTRHLMNMVLFNNPAVALTKDKISAMERTWAKWTKP